MTPPWARSGRGRATSRCPRTTWLRQEQRGGDLLVRPALGNERGDTVAAPTALGEGRLAGSNEQTGVEYFYANERATLAQQPVVLDRRTDAFDRSPVVEESPYIASERSAPARPDVSTYLDANERGTVPSTPSVTPASTGDGIEWPQVGIGFGIGMLLAIVLGLSLKATRPRTLAH